MSDVVIRKAAIDAVIFDLDGVITRTAAVHRRAWKALFDRYLRTRADRSGEPFEPFTTADYGEYVDGKPRYDGVQSFLESRGIDLPWGDPADSPDEETVCGLGNRKNAEFLDVVAEDGVEPYESSVRLVRDLQASGIGTALFSSSRNALAVLDAAGLGGLFSVVVDGRVGDDLDLPGKPDPAYLIEAASRLGATPERTAVVEDALSGVEAGKRGGFALVIGVDRIDQAAALHDNGADVVVADLAEARVAPEASRPMSELPNALTAGDELMTRFDGRQPVVFLDYDGTLTPIVAHPDMAVLAPDMRRVLEELAAITTVAIVSGRDADDVIDKVGVDGISYAGSHGFDIRAPGGAAVAAGELARFASFLPELDAAEHELREALDGVPGRNVERKRFAIAVHYRQVPEDRHADVARAVEEIAPRHPTLRVAGGKMIYELRPDIDWDKGKALAWLLGEMGLDRPDVVPLYIGDDVTDEDAFREVRGRGIGIVVGREERPSAATYALDDTGEVGVFLSRLAAAVEAAS